MLLPSPGSSSGCSSSCPSGNTLAFAFLSCTRRNQYPIARKATPPTTPPTIAPVSLEEVVFAGVGAGVAGAGAWQHVLLSHVLESPLHDVPLPLLTVLFGSLEQS